MQNEIILTRKINIQTWHVKGTVAKAKKRKDILLVLKYLNEFYTGTAKDIASHLLFEGNARNVVAKRLLEISELYGLVEEVDSGNYQLTDKGEKALQEKKCFIPEDCCWELSVTNDRLLPHPVIELCAFNEPNAVSEVIGREAKDKMQKRQENIESIPRFFYDIQRVELKPHVGGEDIRIDAIEQKAEEVKAKFSLMLEWNVGENRVRLLEGQKVITQFSGPRLTIDSVWQNLLENEGRLQHWDRYNEKLEVPFDEVDDASKTSMASDFVFAKPRILNQGKDLGKFNKVRIQGISICAATHNDAYEWALWRLENSIKSFASKSKYKKWIEKAQEPFKSYSIKLPERDEVARAMIDEKRTNKSWFLLAALDWDL